MCEQESEVNPAYSIKGLWEINFQDCSLWFFFFDTVKSLLSNPYGFMYLTIFQKSELFFGDDLWKDLLKSLCNNFCDHLVGYIAQRDRFLVLQRFWRVFFLELGLRRFSSMEDGGHHFSLFTLPVVVNLGLLSHILLWKIPLSTRMALGFYLFKAV